MKKYFFMFLIIFQIFHNLFCQKVDKIKVGIYVDDVLLTQNITKNIFLIVFDSTNTIQIDTLDCQYEDSYLKISYKKNTDMGKRVVLILSMTNDVKDIEGREHLINKKYTLDFFINIVSHKFELRIDDLGLKRNYKRMKVKKRYRHHYIYTVINDHSGMMVVPKW